MTNHDFIKNDKSSQKSISHLSPQQMNSVIAMGLFLAWKNKMETVEDPEPLPENLQNCMKSITALIFVPSMPV